jgi:serine phosphatase RsbU (regulator of sigma subunit)
MSRLIITHGPGAGRTIEPSEAGAVIGRQPGLEVTLDSGAISRRHAKVTWEGERLFVEDLGSSNGTFINEMRIAGRTQIQPHDSLRIGTSIFRLELAAWDDTEMTVHNQTEAAASNTELFRHQAAAKLQAVLQLAHHLGHSLEIDTILGRLLDQLMVLVPHADRALVLLRDGDEPSVRAQKSRTNQESRRPPFSRSVLKKVFTQSMAVLAKNTAPFSRSVLKKVFTQSMAVLAKNTANEQEGSAYFTLTSLGIQSVMCVPLKTHDSRVFGALQLDRFQSDQAFSSDDLYLLTAVALMVAPVLENAQLLQQLLVKERMQRDLAMAREIQLGYLPRGPVHMAGGPVELLAELHPALEVSGDFYDYFPLDDHRLAFAVADVSGKGMPAALFMAMVHALTRLLAQTADGPADLIARLNDAIAQDNPSFLFVTMVFGIYDAATGRVTLAHGGHPPVLVRRHDGAVEQLGLRGAPLLGTQRHTRRSDEAVVQLAPGDAVVLYTDGVTESPGLQAPHELFGADRLNETVQALAPAAPLPAWTAAIRQAVTSYSGPELVADDITLLVLRRPPTTAA